MRTLLIAIAVGAALPIGVASAADLSQGHGRRHYNYAAGSAMSGFYIRADVGLAAHGVGSFSQSDVVDNGGSFLSKSIGDATVLGFGIGKQIDHRFRLDLTGEYRGKASAKGLDNLSATLVGPDGTLVANTLYQGNLSAFVGLLNVYADLFKWRGLTPYVGAGIGIARTSMSDITTLSTATFTETATGAITTQVAPGTGGDKSKTGLAWALMAGVSAEIGSVAKLDIGYRYLNLGSEVAATTDLLHCVCGSVGQPLTLRDIDSHEIRIGLRVPLSSPANVAHQSLK